MKSRYRSRERDEESDLPLKVQLHDGFCAKKSIGSPKKRRLDGLRSLPRNTFEYKDAANPQKRQMMPAQNYLPMAICVKGQQS